MQLGYAYYASDPTLPTVSSREEVSLGSVLKLSEYWRLFGNTTRDLSQRVTISNRIGVGYPDECFGLSVGFYQSDRKSVVYGKSVSLRVDLGVRRIIKTKT